jgi:hypothetical protein
MSGCEVGSLKHRGWDSRDPYELKDKLNEVTFFFDSGADAYWHSLAGADPAAVLKDRMKEKMYLARYAHISPFEWADRPLSELHEHFEALHEIIVESKGGLVAEENEG